MTTKFRNLILILLIFYLSSEIKSVRKSELNSLIASKIKSGMYTEIQGRTRIPSEKEINNILQKYHININTPGKTHIEVHNYLLDARCNKNCSCSNPQPVICKDGEILNHETNQCVPVCDPNQGKYDPITKTCVPHCEENFIYDIETKTCKPICNADEVYDPVTKSCKIPCKDNEKFDKATKSCKPICNANEFWDPATESCRKCKFNEKLDPDTNKCVPLCTEKEKYDPVNKVCIPLCKEDEVYDPITRRCRPLCNDLEKYNEEKKKCVPACEDGQVFDPLTKTCVFKCVMCQPGEVLDQPTKTCVSICGPGKKYDKELKDCVEVCNRKKGLAWNKPTGKCACIENSHMDDDGKGCTCNAGFEFDEASNKCETKCPAADEYWDIELSLCVKKCADNQQYNIATRKCECQYLMIWNEQKGVCNCPQGKEQKSANAQCTEICPNDQEWVIPEEGKDGKCQNRCNLPLVWNEVIRKCDCMVGMIFNSSSEKCECTGDAIYKDGACVVICHEGYRVNGDKCELICKKENGAVWCEADKVCKCIEPNQVFNELTEKCEEVEKPIVDKCPDVREIFDDEQNKCICNEKKNFKVTEMGCGCLQPYKLSEDLSECIFDPQCEEGQKWDATDLICKHVCNVGNVWDIDKKECVPAKCEDPVNMKMNEETKICEWRCGEGRKWCNICKLCLDACNEIAGYKWNKEEKKCEKICTGVRPDYNSRSKECDCPSGREYNAEKDECRKICGDNTTYNPETKNCSANCIRGYRQVDDGCMRETTLPDPELKKDVTENVGYDKQCSWRGYHLDGICHCPNWFTGDSCEKEVDQIGWMLGNKTSLIAARTTLSFSIYSGYYPGKDDPLFPRTQASIGNGVGQRGPIGDNWISLHSMINDKFQIFDSQGNINVLDIKQGNFGNSYLLSSIAAMASVREGILIKDAFLTPYETRARIYNLKLRTNGRIQVVSVDDWVPSLNDQPTGTKLNGKDVFWVQLMEKSWAKTLGSYQATFGGHSSQVLTSFTGATNEFYDHKAEQDVNKVFTKINEAFKQGRPITAWAESGKLDNGHSYAVVGCFVVVLNGQNFNLVKHFNPLNQGSLWKENPWGDNSENLKAVADQIPDFLGDDKDGFVYQEISDYVSNFSHTLISNSLPGYSAISKEIPFNDQIEYNTFGEYDIKFTVEEKHAGKRLIVYIAHNHERSETSVNLDAGWKCRGITITDEKGNKFDSFILNSGGYGYDPYHQVIIENPIAGEYSLRAEVKQVSYFKTFPLVIYGVTDEVRFENGVAKLPLWKEEEIKKCENACTSGICDFSIGKCQPPFKSDVCFF